MIGKKEKRARKDGWRSHGEKNDESKVKVAPKKKREIMLRDRQREYQRHSE